LFLVDDNVPEFARDVFTGGISTDVDFGTVVVQVLAEDADDPSVQLEYALDGEISASEGSEGLSDIRRPPFTLESDTGNVLLNFDPQKGMKGYFDFGVKVLDRAGHVDKARVRIYLLREDQRVRIVMRNNPAQVRKWKWRCYS
jgi:hypothetical protein